MGGTKHPNNLKFSIMQKKLPSIVEKALQTVEGFENVYNVLLQIPAKQTT